MKKPTCSALVLILFCTSPLFAVSPSEVPDLSARMHQLEMQSQALQAEVQWLREHPTRLPATTATPVSMTSMLDDDGVADGVEDMRAEMEALVWKKGDFKIVPYGFLWTVGTYETERTSNKGYTLFVPSADAQGEDAFHIDFRATRLGIDVAGPRIARWCCAESGGKLEIDFQSPVSGAFDNRPTVLLRHAYWEVKNDDFRLLAGQTWDVISPLYPGMLMYSVGWGGGNIGYRRAQFRAERYVALSNTKLLTLQGSLNQDVVLETADFAEEPSSWPVLEGRLGLTLGPRGKNCLPITTGISGHIGEQGFDDVLPGDDHRRRTWSFNTDIRIPVSHRAGFQGEFHTGENLGTFLGGAIQGLNTADGRSIRTTGGWFEFWYDWNTRWHSHLGYGIDDPFDQDLAGDSRGRISNQFLFANLSHNVTKKLLVGTEVSFWKTHYLTQRPGESVVMSFMAKYGF